MCHGSEMGLIQETRTSSFREVTYAGYRISECHFRRAGRNNQLLPKHGRSGPTNLSVLRLSSLATPPSAERLPAAATPRGMGLGRYRACCADGCRSGTVTSRLGSQSWNGCCSWRRLKTVSGDSTWQVFASPNRAACAAKPWAAGREPMCGCSSARVEANGLEATEESVTRAPP